MPTALIVGAGLTGLIAAGSLVRAGWTVQLIESSKDIGGRMATRYLAGQAFDCGAQFFSVRERAFAELVQPWLDEGLAVPWCQGFSHYQAGSLQPAVEDGFARYHIPGGMQRLAEHLATSLPVQRGTTLQALDVAESRVRARVQGNQGTTVTAAAAILTAPLPLALATIAAGRQERALSPALRSTLSQAGYAPCICLLVDFAHAMGQAIPAPGGMRIEDEAIAWIASQRAKGMRATGEGLVIHAHPAWSAAHEDEGDAALLEHLMEATQRILARLGSGDWREPTAARIERWHHSLATQTLADSCILADLGAPVVFAGDAFGNRPRMEGAALSGLAAAAVLLERVPPGSG